MAGHLSSGSQSPLQQLVSNLREHQSPLDGPNQFASLHAQVCTQEGNQYLNQAFREQQGPKDALCS